MEAVIVYSISSLRFPVFEIFTVFKLFVRNCISAAKDIFYVMYNQQNITFPNSQQKVESLANNMELKFSFGDFHTFMKAFSNPKMV